MGTKCAKGQRVKRSKCHRGSLKVRSSQEHISSELVSWRRSILFNSKIHFNFAIRKFNEEDVIYTWSDCNKTDYNCSISDNGDVIVINTTKVGMNETGVWNNIWYWTFSRATSTSLVTTRSTVGVISTMTILLSSSVSRWVMKWWVSCKEWLSSSLFIFTAVPGALTAYCQNRRAR